jgi:hypothetical protein
LVSTHGIDVIPDPDRADEAVYIFAIHHPPSPAYLEAFTGNRRSSFRGEKEQPKIEIFHHVLASSSARHVRTVEHPLILRPNDIAALDLHTFNVTNDHYYAGGPFRFLEQAHYRATWSNVVRVSTKAQVGDASPVADVTATIALDRVHNANGLTIGRRRDELLVSSCASGTLNFCSILPNGTLAIRERVMLDSVIDNPTYFRDPFETTERDASGFVMIGPTRGIDIGPHSREKNARDGVLTWFLQPRLGSPNAWDTKLLFEDDGSRIRSGSTAAIVGIDPKLEGGKKMGWLFATGYWAQNIIAVKVSL